MEVDMLSVFAETGAFASSGSDDESLPCPTTRKVLRMDIYDDLVTNHEAETIVLWVNEYLEGVEDIHWQIEER